MNKLHNSAASLMAGLLLILATMTAAHAQVFPRGNGISLSGVQQFDAYMGIGDWVGLDRDMQEFRTNAQRIFVSGLESTGATRRAATGNNLVCRVQATGSDDLIAYATRIEYWVMNDVGVNVLYWENGSIGAVASSSFNEELVASECLKYFTEEWSKWNPHA